MIWVNVKILSLRFLPIMKVMYGMILRRIRKKKNGFGPADVTIGTDGAIYIADWYDPVVGGHQMKDSIGYGRIYRITPKNKKLANPKIDLSTIQGQIEAFKNPAVNVRNSAFEKLKQQGDVGN